MKRGPFSRRGRNSHVPADAADGVLDHVQPDPAAGELGHRGGRAEAGQEEELEQLGGREPGGHVGRVQPALDHLLAEPVQVDAAAVVGDGDEQHPGAVPRFHGDRAGRRFVRRAAHAGHLQPVIDRVADQVRQRRFELLQDVAVHLGAVADDDQPRLLAERPGHVADEPREAVGAVAERAHAAGDDLAVQADVEVFGAGRVVVEVGGLGIQLLPARGPLAAGVGDQVGELDRGHPAGGGVVRGVEHRREQVVLLLQLEQRRGERRQPPRLNERFAGQPHEAVEALGRDPHDRLRGQCSRCSGCRMRRR